MKGSTILNIIAAECPRDDEEKFNKWYDEIHVPMLLKFKGIKKVTRCKFTGGNEGLPNYLAIWEFESQEAFEEYERSPELEAAMVEQRETWGDSFPRKWRAQYKVVGNWRRPH